MLWPDMDVVDYLDSVAAFEQDGQVMSEAMAKALRDDQQPTSTFMGKPLPSWKDRVQSDE